MKNNKFIPGLEMNRSFFFDEIKPFFLKQFPQLVYSAGLIGYGSDVIGFDSETSTDHNWGPRCLIFLDEKDSSLINTISEQLSVSLPVSYKNYPTNFTDPRYDFTQKMEAVDNPPIRHLVEIFEFDKYFRDQLHINDVSNITINDWLSFNDQVLYELTSGEVFYDGLQRLESIRKTLKFYPEDILKLRLSSLWQSVWNEEPFVGRCIESDDYIGLKLITSRIVTMLIKVSFYIQKKYIPYSKWIGTALQKTSAFVKIGPYIKAVLSENTPKKIETKLCDLYVQIIKLHNENASLPKIENTITNFFGRPYKVIFAERIVEKLKNSISDEKISTLNLDKIALDLKIDSVDFTE